MAEDLNDIPPNDILLSKNERLHWYYPCDNA
jgi:hypothetical protein